MLLFSAMMEVVEAENDNCKLQLGQLASITSDGVPVMISQRNGVAEKLKSSVNPKRFITHWHPHCLVRTSKPGQKHIPEEVQSLNVTHYFTSKSVEFIERSSGKYRN